MHAVHASLAGSTWEAASCRPKLCKTYVSTRCYILYMHIYIYIQKQQSLRDCYPCLCMGRMQMGRALMCKNTVFGLLRVFAEGFLPHMLSPSAEQCVVMCAARSMLSTASQTLSNCASAFGIQDLRICLVHTPDLTATPVSWQTNRMVVDARSSLAPFAWICKSDVRGTAIWQLSS